MMTTEATKPVYVTTLEAAYGAPSQAGFGSAVFFERSASDLVKTARAKYKFFVGDNWERFGEATWLRQWKLVYARPENAKHDIVAELRAISDAQAKLSVPMILEAVENASKARHALSAAFDNVAVSQLAVFNIGDGEAMSGILIAGNRENGGTTCLVFMLD